METMNWQFKMQIIGDYLKSRTNSTEVVVIITGRLFWDQKNYIAYIMKKITGLHTT